MKLHPITPTIAAKFSRMCAELQAKLDQGNLKLETK